MKSYRYLADFTFNQLQLFFSVCSVSSVHLACRYLIYPQNKTDRHKEYAGLFIKLID